jgi:tRNA dimethylallyltransferase
MTQTQNKTKIIAIVGPTATGKSDCAVDLALSFDGEVISADSRQVYKKLNIATGKITPEEMRGVPHHLLSFVDPKKIFTVASYKAKAEIAISDIVNRGKVPFLCGGTGFYLKSIIENEIYPEVPPNTELRDKLAEESTEELFRMLVNKDKKRAHRIDKNNRVRLIRALEIINAIGEVPEIEKKILNYNILQIGLDLPDDELRKNIHKRTEQRLENGMIKEAQDLLNDGVSYERMNAFGLEYRLLAQHIQGKITYQELSSGIEKEDFHYAKRQRTWFKRDKQIIWFDPSEREKIQELTEKFLNKDET